MPLRNLLISPHPRSSTNASLFQQTLQFRRARLDNRPVTGHLPAVSSAGVSDREPIVEGFSGTFVVDELYFLG